MTRLYKLTKFRFLICLPLACAFSWSAKADVIEIKEEDLKMNVELRRDVLKTLQHFNFRHYLSSRLDDDFSSRIFDAYLEILDRNKIFFTQDDINAFEPYRFKLDDVLLKSNAEPAFDIFKLYRKRVDQRIKKAMKWIEHDFDYTKTESINLDNEEIEWAKGDTEINERWRKRIKNDMLVQLLGDTPEEEVRSNLEKRYQRQRDTAFQLKADEVFEWFMNSYAREIEPHSQYMSDITAENFRINMSLQLEGIGAALQTEQDYTVINRIIPGGPAEKSDAIHPEDKIIGVAQDGEDMINVIGWRLMDVVQMIRGKKGTKVILQIQAHDSVPGSPPTTIELVRDVIQLEDQAAKLSEVELESKQGSENYAVISIPSFYANNKKVRKPGDPVSTSYDVARLLESEEVTDADGLIIDLRGNGGGYLTEAIKLTGLFIESGPIVQVQDSQGRTQVLPDRNPEIAYTGPMLVLMDRLSASASEIFAAALQDYGRAIVVGERSFGKGTVQQVIPLRQQGSDDHESQIKYTTAQFFRINGGSTQHKGVTPDIFLNSGIEDEDFGERSYDNALPWSQIKSADYQSRTINSSLLSTLSENHMTRSLDNPAFKYLRDNSAFVSQVRDVKMLSLNIDERRKLTEEREKQSLALINDYRKSLDLEPVTKETRKDNPLPDEDEHWNIVRHKEAAKILSDSIRTNREYALSWPAKVGG